MQAPNRAPSEPRTLPVGQIQQPPFSPQRWDWKFRSERPIPAVSARWPRSARRRRERQKRADTSLSVHCPGGAVRRPFGLRSVTGTICWCLRHRTGLRACSLDAPGDGRAELAFERGALGLGDRVRPGFGLDLDGVDRFFTALAMLTRLSVSVRARWQRRPGGQPGARIGLRSIIAIPRGRSFSRPPTRFP